MLRKAVGRESSRHVEARLAAGNHIQNPGPNHCSDQLRDPVLQDLARREFFPVTNPSVTAGLRWQPEMCPMA